MRKKVLPAVTVVSGDVECRLGPGDELLYLGPRQGGGVVHGEVHTERDGLRIDAYYTGWADTGVFTRDAVVTNTGRRPAQPSLAWTLPAGGFEMKPAGPALTFALHDPRSGVRALAQLAAPATAPLAPGKSMRLPAAAFTLEGAHERLRSYQRRFVAPEAKP